MHLKRLELAGFKSFADKTTLEFPAGIVAVVGPNGSGKSNIIDAIRWLLGEREAKNMRGARAEDLVFSGTENRSRMSLAQATIVFDNKEQFFPVDYEEVAIKRRIERDGSSQYYLNDAEVRVKDVIDFFSKSRLGTKGFSIINQGDSDLFVRSSPKERRAMLEEILGLRQFQLKKHEAELKLKNTRINMEKAKALIEEIIPHLRLLRRQTAKWEKHDDLQKELTELEAEYFGAKRVELDEEYQVLEPKLKSFDTTISERTKEVAALHDGLKKVEAEQPASGTPVKTHDNEKKKLFDRKSEIQRELGKLEAQIELFAERPDVSVDSREVVAMLEEARQVIEDALLEDEIDSVRKLLQELFDKINQLLDEDSAGPKPTERPDFELNRKELTGELEKIDISLTELLDRDEDTNVALRAFNEKFKAAYEALEKKKDELSSIETKKNKLLFERERIDIKRGELAHQAEQIGRKLDEFSPKKFDGSLDALERKMLKLRGELAGIGEIDEALIKEAEETETRHTFLKTQLEDLEKAYTDLSTLIKELDGKIHTGFKDALKKINTEFNTYFKMMFGGGHAKLVLQKAEPKMVESEEGEVIEEESDADHAIDHGGLDITLSIPRKRISSLDALSGGEKTLVSIVVLFALISVSPPPFLVLDEIDAPLDEVNTKRFAGLIKEFSKRTQFLIVTHNRATMEASDILYGITMGDDGTSRVLSLKLEDAEAELATSSG